MPHEPANGGLLPTARADQAEPSVFLAANLLREARRQRRLVDGLVPPVSVSTDGV